MRRWWCTLVLVVGAATALAAPGIAQDEPPIMRYMGYGLTARDWRYEFDFGRMVPLTETDRITGFAFGPGRAEVAYCAPTGQEGRWGLWVVAVSFPPPDDAQPYRFRITSAARRLLWTAPEGVMLRGPVWWAPDGSKIAVRGCRDDAADVVAVEYGSGEPVWVARGVKVVDLVWGPRSDRAAYVTEENGGRAVWLQSIPPGEPSRLGDGGYDLRWSLDGRALRWLRPRPEGVWIEATWDAATGEVSEANPQPARPAEAMWSPDGRLCAVIEQSEKSGKNQLLIYPTRSTTAEKVALPHVEPERLLGWSPDGRLVVVLGDADFPVAVAVTPASKEVKSTMGVAAERLVGRVAICGYPMDADAGVPSWSSRCDIVAYVFTDAFDDKLQVPPDMGFPYGHLVATPVRREYIKRMAPKDPESELVLSNMKNVALAVQMYLSDNNDVFPPTGDSEEAWWILNPYVKNRGVFMRPGTEDEMVVQYLVPPGVRLVEIRDPTLMPVAVVDYHPDFFVIAYGDGHASTFEKEGEYWEKWEAWWREYWEKREREEP